MTLDSGGGEKSREAFRSESTQTDQETIAPPNADDVATKWEQAGTSTKFYPWEATIAESGFDDFRAWRDSIANNDGSNNPIYAWGYNTKGAGVRNDTSEPSAYWAMESNWQDTSDPSGSGGDDYIIENYLQVKNEDGSFATRPIFIKSPREAGQSWLNMLIRADDISWEDPTNNDTQWMRYLPNQIRLKSGTTIRKEDHNEAILEARLSGGSMAEILRINADNDLELGKGMAIGDKIDLSGQVLGDAKIEGSSTDPRADTTPDDYLHYKQGSTQYYIPLYS